VILGVLLAGGRGRRLGLEVPKALARVGGITLFERAVATLRAVCDTIVIVAPRDIELPGSEGLPRIHDEGRGPLPALLVALEHHRADRVVALGVDYPRLGAEMVRALIARLDAMPATSGAARAVVPAPGGVDQPLAAVYDRAACDRLAERWRAGDRSFVAALQSLDVTRLTDEDLAPLPGGIESFLNLNSPADMSRAIRTMTTRIGIRTVDADEP
jgi:molybdopterin-guanine dinucleotide biosynthesis protein A